MAYYKCGQIYVTENTNTSVGTASGAVSTFNTLVSKPLVSLKASFKATQASGTPTPSNPISIDGVSNVKVTRCGKNLVDINYLTASGITISGNEASGTAQAFSDNFGLNTNGLTQLKFKTNTAYTLSFKAYTDGSYSTSGTGLYFKILYTDGSYTSLAVNNNQQEFGYFNKTTSASRTIDKIQIAYSGGYSNTWYIKEIQLEEDSTASDYEQYNGDSVTIALGGTYYGGYIAKDASGNKLVLTYEYADLSDFTWNSTADGYSQSPIIPNMKKSAGGAIKPNLFSDKLLVDTPANVYNKVTDNTISISIAGANSGLRVYMTSLSGYTGAQVKSALAGFKIAYELETPIELPLTDIPDITTLTGVNNVFNDSENTEVKYTASPFVIGNASGSVANFTTPYTKPLISLQASALATKVYQRGANLWDGDWEVGTYNTNTGAKESSGNTRIRSKNLIPITPNSTLYFTQIGTGAGLSFLFYDKDGTFKNGYYRANTTGGFSYTTQSDWHFLAISPGDAYGTTYNNDIAVRFDNSFDYVAYNPNSNEYVIADLGNITTLSGVNNIFADSGDIVECKYWGANT